MRPETEKRIIEMQFDNKQFERGVDSTVKDLTRLKKSLNMDDAIRGLEQLNSTKMLDGLSKSLSAIEQRLSAFGIATATIISSITMSAFNKLHGLFNKEVMLPARQGFSEYELQINSTQTILNNVKDSGKGLDDVNAALDKLNLYADQTIYNFTQMTSAIGKFTNAGIGLDDSVQAIKGISNLAAFSGAGAEQANSAMYNISQSLQSGYLQAIDYRSLENAGITGKKFQDIVKVVAKKHKVNIEGLLKKYGSIRDSLQTKWFNKDILMEVLGAFGGDKTEEEWINLGYTRAQAEEFVRLGKEASEAATKVKTFTQLWDTLGEAKQSGWSQSFRLIIGDFDQAKGLLTSISDAFGERINKASKWRNDLLEGWVKAGGRDKLIDTFWNFYRAFDNVTKIAKDAWSKIFPPMTVKMLTNLTDTILNFSERLLLFINDGDVGRFISGVVTSLGWIYDIGKNIVSNVLEALFKSMSGFKPLFDAIGKLFGSIGAELEKLKKRLEDNEIYKQLAETLTTVFNSFSESVVAIYESLKDLFRPVVNQVKEWLKALGLFGDAEQELTDEIVDGAEKVGDSSKKGGKKIVQFLKSVAEWSIQVKQWILDTIESIRNSTFIQDIGKFFSTTFGPVLEWLKSTAAAIWDVISSLFGKKTSDIIEDENRKTVVDSINENVLGDPKKLKLFEWYDKVKQSLTKVFNGIKLFFANLFAGNDPIQAALQNGADKANDGKIPENVKAKLALNWEKIKSWFIDLYYIKIPEFFKNLGNTLSRFFQWVLDSKLINVLERLAKLYVTLSIGSALRGVAKVGSGIKKLGKGFQRIGEGVKDLANKGFQRIERKKDTLGTTMFKIAASLALVVGAIWLLSKIDKDKIDQGIGILVGVLLGLAAVSLLLKKFDSDIGKQFFALGAGLAALVIPIYVFGTLMSKDQLTQGLIGLGVMALGLVAFIGILYGLEKAFERGDKKLGAGVFIKIAVALWLMTFALRRVVKLVREGSEKEVLIAAGIIAGMALIMSAASTISKLGNGKSALLSLAVSVGILVWILNMLYKAPIVQENDYEKLAKALGIIVTLMLGSSLASAGSFGQGKSALFQVALSVGILVGLLWVIDRFIVTSPHLMDSLLVFGGVIAALITAVTFTNAMTIPKGLLALAGAVIMLVGAIWLVTLMDPAKAWSGFLIVGSIIVALIGFSRLAKAVDTKGLLAMVGAVALLALVVVLLAAATIFIGLERMLWGVGMLVAIMLALGVMSKIAKDASKGLMKAVLPLIIVMGALVLALYLVKDVDWKVILAFTGGLALLVASMALLAPVLNHINPTTMIKAGVAIAGFVTVIGAALALIGTTFAQVIANAGVQFFKLGVALNLASKMFGSIDPRKFENGNKVVDIVSSMLSGIPNVISGKARAYGNEAVELGGRLKLFSSSMKDVNVRGVSKVMEDLNGMNYAISTMTNSGVNYTEFGNSLTHLGSAIKLYYLSFEGITDEQIGNSEKVKDKAGVLNEVMAAIAKTNIDEATLSEIEKFGSMSGAADGTTLFAIGLTALGTAIKSYGESIKDLDSNAVENANRVLTMVNYLDAQMIQNGSADEVTDWFAGKRQTLVDFAANIVILGDALYNYGESIKGIDPEKMSNTVIVLESLSTLQKELEKTGGVISWFVGNKDLTEFSVGITSLGVGLQEFSNGVKGLQGKKYVDTAIEKLSALADIQAKIDSTGMLKSVFGSTRSLSDFGGTLSGLGTGMVDFKKGLDQIIWTEDDSYKLTSFLGELVSIDKSLSSHSLEGSGIGALTWSLGQLGINMLGYYEAIKSIDIEQMMGVTSALSAIADAQAIANESNGVLSPTIRPVVDLSGTQEGVDNLNAILKEIDPVWKALELSTGNINIRLDNREVVNAIRDLNERVGHLGNQMSNMQMVLDTGVLVGAISNQINQELGRMMYRNGRGGVN